MTAPRPPRINPGPPYAEVEQVGRWTWFVRLTHGISRVDAFHVYGTRRRADLRAERALRRYIAREERTARTQHRVTS